MEGVPPPRKRERGIHSVLPSTKGGLHNAAHPGPKVPERVYQDATLQNDHPTGVIPLIRKGEYLATLNLKDAYLHIPVCKSHRKYLSFIIGSTHYQFKVLAFGVISAGFSQSA